LVYRLLKAHDLITSPDYVVMLAAHEFKDKTTALVAWRLGPTTRASDVTATLDQALATSGLDDITHIQRPSFRATTDQVMWQRIWPRGSRAK
jgi:putative transposase